MDIFPHPDVLLPDLTKEYAGAKPGLYHWSKTTELAEWRTPEDVKKTFNSVDFVKVRSGRTVAVFNLGGKKFRLTAFIRYDTKRVFFLRLLPHHIYSKDRWVHEL
jgi:mRNA-degrading endonuclease HigB of HigAB toxin-antitoxin module